MTEVKRFVDDGVCGFGRPATHLELPDDVYVRATDYDAAQARIAQLEAALRESCGYLVNFIVLADSRQEESVDEFLVRWTEFSGVVSNKPTTAETKADET